MKTRKLSLIFTIVIASQFFTGCSNYHEYNNNPHDNFTVLWTILDENYCFFEYKNINWDSVYYAFEPRVTNEMGMDSFFDVMAEMLSTLKDGHVNLIASHDITRYWNWSEDFPENFNAKIIKDNYLGNNYSIVGGISYKVLEDNIGYLRYSSFADNVTHTGIAQIVKRFSKCRGIIIDIRNNGGGNLTNVEQMASQFFNEKTLIGYISHKTGKGHSDFSDLYPKFIENKHGYYYPNTVAILTNRSCYSAANDFVNTMKNAPKSIIIGDKTGGGSGLPFSSEIPNGWSIRFSSSPIFNVNKEHIEFGIEPDIRVDLKNEDILNGKDTMIETAKSIIDENTSI